ncbi:hypothetical protein SAMN05192561_101208 [Halopenitus malekzadehii]|uniref:DUF7260 domain-containing protein n=1 Tax=Halopenitus malekzadehii TaxID=1267564 RepID=A0A1H6HP36_9EURY|nr:hypothetical protein [Halopenitus malekzadehii]SEH37531.1 hypothetical protein SAMN05192561_101208 [Halopenitus malekzadehii]
MSVETAVHAALDRVDAEAERVDSLAPAFGRFDAAVRDLDPLGGHAPSSGEPTRLADGGITAAHHHDRQSGRPGTPDGAAGVTGSAGVTGGAVAADRTGSVRDAFAETVLSARDEGSNASATSAASAAAVVRAIRSEFGDEIAVVLAPGTDAGFTPAVKRAVRSAIATRRAELRALRDALDRERESLRSARGDVDAIVSWIARADETPLSDLGFEALRDRHETLERHRERCAERLESRQTTLGSATGHGADAGLTHRSLVAHLYDVAGFPTPYPVVSTVVRLIDCCESCQRSVRDHLTRRV